MKKILKATAALVLSGAVVLCTGCTKDYGGDISELAEQVEALSIVVAGQSSQIQSLEGVVASLKTTQETIQNDIKILKQAKTDLETAVAKKADKTEIDAINAKISAIETAIGELETLSAQNAKNIADLQEDLAKKADKTWVEQTYATIEWVKEINTTLGALSQTVAQIQGVDIPAINATLSQLRTDLDKAAADASKALGETAEIRNMLNNYYTSAQVDALLNSMKGEINESITALKNKDAELKAAIEKQEQQLRALVEAIDKKADKSYVETIEQNLAALKKQVEESVAPDVTKLLAKINGVEIKVAALASRIQSIVICPSAENEIYSFYVGNDPALCMQVMKASFIVTPSELTDSIAKHMSNLNVLYSEALPREGTKASALIQEATITSVEADKANGTITVYARNIKSKKSAGNALYFAINWRDSDAAGAAEVTSEFVRALENKDVINLTPSFKNAKYLDGNKVEFLEELTIRDTVDYIAAKDYKVKPFDRISLAFDNRGAVSGEKKYSFFAKEIMTPAEFVAATGMMLSCACQNIAEKPLVVSGNDNDSEVSFDTKVDLYTKVRKNPYTVVEQKHLRGAALDELTFAVVLTKVRHETVTLPAALLNWNYITFDYKDRKDTVDASKPTAAYDTTAWNEAIRKDAKVTTAFFSTIATFKDKENGYQPICIALSKDQGTIASIGTKCIKETVSDEYSFSIHVDVEKPLVVTATAAPVSIDGSVTVDRKFTMKAVDSMYICTGPNTVNPRLISGLKGKAAELASVKAAFNAQMAAATKVVKVNGVVKSDAQVTYKNGNFDVTLAAGTVTYDQKVTITVVCDKIFGQTYTVNQALTVKEPTFELGTKNWIVSGVGTAVGAFTKGVYTLEDMYYNKQVEVLNIANLTKAEADTLTEKAVVVKFTASNNKVGNANGKNGIKVSLADGSLFNPLLTWGDFNDTTFTMSAQLYIAGVKVGKSISYTITTKRPVRYVSNAEYKATRKAKDDLDLNLYKNAVVYGVVENKELEANIVDGTGAITKYPKTRFEYDDPDEWIVTLNGSAPTSWVSGVDYIWDNDNEAAKIDPSKAPKAHLTIMGDNLKGELKITMKSRLYHYLDNGKPQEMPINITINQD